MLRSLEYLLLFTEDPGSIPRPKWWLMAIHNPRSRGPDALFCPLRASGLYTVQAYMQAKQSHA